MLGKKPKALILRDFAQTTSFNHFHSQLQSNHEITYFRPPSDIKPEVAKKNWDDLKRNIDNFARIIVNTSGDENSFGWPHVKDALQGLKEGKKVILLSLYDARNSDYGDPELSDVVQKYLTSDTDRPAIKGANVVVIRGDDEAGAFQAALRYINKGDLPPPKSAKPNGPPEGPGGQGNSGVTVGPGGGHPPKVGAAAVL